MLMFSQGQDYVKMTSLNICWLHNEDPPSVIVVRDKNRTGVWGEQPHTTDPYFQSEVTIKVSLFIHLLKNGSLIYKPSIEISLVMMGTYYQPDGIMKILKNINKIFMHTPPLDILKWATLRISEIQKIFINLKLFSCHLRPTVCVCHCCCFFMLSIFRERIHSSGHKWKLHLKWKLWTDSVKLLCRIVLVEKIKVIILYRLSEYFWIYK